MLLRTLRNVQVLLFYHRSAGHRAITTGDAKLLEQAAHALKGISGTVGANEMLDLAVRLEEYGRSGRTDDAAEVVSALEGAVARARPIFMSLRGNALTPTRLAAFAVFYGFFAIGLIALVRTGELH